MGNICPWCCKKPRDEEEHTGGDETSSLTASSHANDRTPLLRDQHNKEVLTYGHSFGDTRDHASSILGSSISQTPGGFLPDFATSHLETLPNTPGIGLTNGGGGGEDETSAPPFGPSATPLTPESTMTKLVERMLPDLINVVDYSTEQQRPSLGMSNAPMSDGTTLIASKLRSLLDRRMFSLAEQPNILPSSSSSALSSSTSPPTAHHSSSSLTNGAGSQNHLPSLQTSSSSSQQPHVLPDCGPGVLEKMLSKKTSVSSDISHYLISTASELSRLIDTEIKIVHREDLVVIFE